MVYKLPNSNLAERLSGESYGLASRKAKVLCWGVWAQGGRRAVSPNCCIWIR